MSLFLINFNININIIIIIVIITIISSIIYKYLWNNPYLPKCQIQL